jgi:hypothetical protein
VRACRCWGRTMRACVRACPHRYVSSAQLSSGCAGSWPGAWHGRHRAWGVGAVRAVAQDAVAERRRGHQPIGGGGRHRMRLPARQPGAAHTHVRSQLEAGWCLLAPLLHHLPRLVWWLTAAPPRPAVRWVATCSPRGCCRHRRHPHRHWRRPAPPRRGGCGSFAARGRRPLIDSAARQIEIMLIVAEILLKQLPGSRTRDDFESRVPPRLLGKYQK